MKITRLDFEPNKSRLIEFRNRNRETARDDAYFEWRYTKRPNNAPPVIVAALDDEGNFLGSLSLIPNHFRVGTETCLLGVLGDISVHESMRGKGLAQSMLNFLAGLDEVRRLKACLVLPNEGAARPLEKCGWRAITSIERYVKVLNVESFMRRRFRDGSALRTFSSAANFLLKSAEPKADGSASGCSFEIIDKFDSRFDDLWDSTAEVNAAAGHRDSSYLNWRYARHPLIHFKVFAATKDNRLSGYVIFAANEAVCNVYDLLYDRRNLRYDIFFKAFFDYARAARFSKIVLNASRAAVNGIPMLRLGFLRRSGQLPVMVLEGGCDGALLSGMDLYLTAGDKDI